MSGIFTLDATMAVVIATIVLGTSIYFTAEPKRQTHDQLYSTAGDLLAVAENKEMLRKAVGKDVSGIEELKSVTPTQICFQLDVRNASGAVVFADDTGCPASQDYAICRRSFVSESRMFLAEMRVWFK